MALTTGVTRAVVTGDSPMASGRPCVRLAGHIKHVLGERATHLAPASRFHDELEDHISDEETLRAVTSWARSGEAFAYDGDGGVFSLDNPS